MTHEFTRVETDGNILKVTMNRPEVYNAIHPQMSHEMDRIWTEFENDPALWVAVLTGAGDRAFSAGNDLKATAAGNQPEPPESGFGGLTMRRRPKPIIAAVNGFAMGGGLETALACDIIIAADTAEIALPEPKVGLIAGAGGIQRLSRQIGRKAAMEMLLTGRRVSAFEAVQLGIANQAVPAADLMGVAMAKAREIASVSPTSVRITMQVLAEMDDREEMLESLMISRRAIAELRRTEDFREGVQAFVEKRTPEWQNR